MESDLIAGYATRPTRGGRPHGDPLPLPRPVLHDVARGRGGPSRTVLRRLCRASDRQLHVAEAVDALNMLAGAHAGGLPSAREAEARPPPMGAAGGRDVPTSPSQDSVMSRIGRRVTSVGPCPEEVDPDGALMELLHMKDLYDEAPKTTVPCDVKRLKILTRDFTAQDLYTRLPPEGRWFLDNSRKTIELSCEEYEAQMVDKVAPKPYWCPALKASRKLRLELVRGLASKGLIGFRERIKSAIGIFCVRRDASKGPWIRMVIDARVVNLAHRSPPRSALAGPGALSSMDLSDAALADAEDVVDFDPENVDIHGAGVDLCDGFYQNSLDSLADWFGIDYPEPAEAYGAQEVFDPLLGRHVAVEPTTLVFPVFRGLAMGWSWALYFCHLMVAAAQGSPSRLFACGLPVIREKFPSPTPTSSTPVAAPYVDNANCIATSAASAALGLEHTEELLADLGLSLHDRVEPTREFIVVGVVFLGGRERRIKPKPRKTWLLYHAIKEIERRSAVPSRIMRCLIGHLTNHFLLVRCSLSAIGALYRIMSEDGAALAYLDKQSRRELQVCRGLIFLSELHLGAEPSPLAFSSDSSMFGYSLSVTEVTPQEVVSITRYRERWRFLQLEPDAPDGEPVRGWSADWGPPSGAFMAWAMATKLARVPDADRRPTATTATRRRYTEVEQHGRVPPLPDAITDEERWRPVVWGSWEWKEVIHLLEARSMLMGLRRTCRCTWLHGLRQASIGDNLPAILAFDKGRSSDRAMLALTRRSCALQLATEILWRLRHVESQRNPDDRGSRMADRGLLRPGETLTGPGCHLSQMTESRTRGQLARPREGRADPMEKVEVELPRFVAPVAVDPLEILGRPPGRWAAARAALARSCRSAREEAMPGHLSLACRRAAGQAAPRRVAVIEHLEPPPQITAADAPRAERRRPLPSRRYFLEVFAGCARLTGAALQHGCHCLPALEILDGPHMDILNPGVRCQLRCWIRSGQLWAVHFGTPCTAFSTANTTGVAKLEGGRVMARITAQLIRLCRRCGVRWTLENPRHSALWDFAPIKKAISHPHTVSAMYDCCAYGTSFRKPQRIDGDLPGLESLSAACACSCTHEQLRGTVHVETSQGKFSTIWKTALAGRYPASLCQIWARVLRAAAPAAARCTHGPGALQRDGALKLARCAGLEPSVTPLVRRPWCAAHTQPEWPAGSDAWGCGPPPRPKGLPQGQSPPAARHHQGGLPQARTNLRADCRPVRVHGAGAREVDRQERLAAARARPSRRCHREVHGAPLPPECGAVERSEPPPRLHLDAAPSKSADHAAALARIAGRLGQGRPRVPARSRGLGGDPRNGRMERGTPRRGGRPVGPCDDHRLRRLLPAERAPQRPARPRRPAGARCPQQGMGHPHRAAAVAPTRHEHDKRSAATAQQRRQLRRDGAHRRHAQHPGRPPDRGTMPSQGVR